MDRSTRRPKRTRRKMPVAGAARENALGGKLTLGKRGVYLVSGDDKLAQFSLISWEQIIAASR
jgi:hypothetical protein